MNLNRSSASWRFWQLALARFNRWFYRRKLLCLSSGKRAYPFSSVKPRDHVILSLPFHGKTQSKHTDIHILTTFILLSWQGCSKSKTWRRECSSLAMPYLMPLANLGCLPLQLWGPGGDRFHCRASTGILPWNVCRFALKQASLCGQYCPKLQNTNGCLYEGTSRIWWGSTAASLSMLPTSNAF